MAAIGWLVTQVSINNRAATLAIRLRNLAQDSQNFNTAVNSLLLTFYGFSSGDAAALQAAAAKMNLLAGVYYGTAGTAIDNFDADLAVLRGTGGPG
jgi:ABC-type transporter Mla subunit MlaD